MKFTEYLSETASAVNEELASSFAQLDHKITSIHPSLSHLSRELIRSMEGGKRIRGTLVRLGWEIAGQEYTPSILKPACAYEIFQTSILAHDDVFDKSPVRRGKPSLYKALGDGHYGISQSLCLGDIGFFFAFQMLTLGDFSDAQKARAVKIFSETLLETGIGELLDIELAHAKDRKAEMEDVLTVYRTKTALYTVTAPLLLGAELGGAGARVSAAIREYGANIGTAYQIQDDIDDIFGDREFLGKEIGLDISEGKNTLLFLHAKEHADAEQVGLLEKYYGKPENFGSDALSAIQEIFEVTGAKEYAEDEARRYIEKGNGVVPDIITDGSQQQLLTGMADFFVKKL